MTIFGNDGFVASRGARGRGERRAKPIAEVLEGRQLLATITVNTTGDANGADGSDTLSLRQAIEISNGTLALSALTPAQANLVVGGTFSPSIIDFDIPGTGPFVISPTSALPTISNPVVINGYSQPGSSPNTNGPRQGKNTVLQIELDGTQAGAGAVGLDLEADSSTVEGLAIGGFSVGLSIESGSTHLADFPDLVEGNFIGTDVTGTLALPNGVGIQGSLGDSGTLSGSTIIGGTTAGAGNVISGNTSDGLSVIEGDLIEGNFIGTDVTGTRALSNGEGNSFFDSEIATIGGTTAAAGNLIAGNFGIGVSVQDLSVVEGNLIGTDVTGTRALPNGTDGVFSGGGDDTIGGTAAGAGNVISGNGGNGLSLQLDGDLIQGNFIGTDITGTRAIPNSLDGIEAIPNANVGDTSRNTIGGTEPGAGNVISGNGGVGVTLGNASQLVGNFIGTDITGTLALPNGDAGVDVLGSGNNIGATFAGAGNVIAFNGGAGVLVNNAAQGNTISGNSIFANQALGIDLGGDGVTPNNPAGSPIGANMLQPYPVLTSTNLTGSGTSISATLDAQPSTSYTVEFFSSPVTDPSGFGQGKAYLGSTVVTTDITGHASFSFSSGQDLNGQAISATATGPNGNTSEFARDVTIGLTTTTDLVGSNQVATLGRPTTFAAVVGASTGGVPGGQVNFLEDGVVIGSAPLNASGVAVFITDSLSPGPHAITVAYTGDLIHAASQSNAVAVSVFAPLAFGGPAVTSVGAMAPDMATITFNRGLLPGPAEDPANYKIVGPGHHSITVESVFYNPETASVTLTTLQNLAPGQSYQLTINGEQGDRIVDVFGIPLNAKKGGKPGHDYVGKFTVKKAPAVIFAHPTGPKSKVHATASKKGH